MTIRSRRLTEKGAIILCAIAAVIAAGMLFLIIGDIIIGALPSLSLHFILTPENKTGLGQGIANAIVGTILLSLASTILATPFGISTAIYLKRYAPENRVTDFIRFMIEVMSGTPSIVVGMFGLVVLVIYLKPFTGGFSFIAGTVALAILIMPVIERAVECAIDTVDLELETGSYALGATKWQTIRGITLPTAINGIMTSLILGFGRAAEESSVVILTAGYSQFIPEIAIRQNDKFFLGFKIYPINDLVGTLPYAVYNAYQNSNVIPMSNAYAIALILITFILLVNITAKVVCSRAIDGSKGNKSDFIPSVCGFIMNPFSVKKPKEVPSYSDVIDPVSASMPPRILPVDLSWIDKEPLLDEPSSGKTEPPESVPPAAEPPKPTPKTTRITVQSVGTGFARLIKAAREKIRRLIHDNMQNKTPAAPVRGTADRAGALRKTQSFNIGWIIGSVRSFLITLAPFALVAVILIALNAIILPLSPVGSNGPAGLLAVPIMALILCLIGTISALFLVRNSTLFLLRHQKGRIGNRRAEFAAIALGVCVVLVSAFIFSAHIFSPVPSIQSPGSEAPAENGIFSYFTPSGNGGLSEISEMIQNNSLFEFLHISGTTTNPSSTTSSNRTAQLAAFLASEETPAEVTPQSSPAALQPSPVAASTVQVSSVGAAVPVKNALDLGESYWYGDNSRPCLATVYNVTVLPFYFYWDMDWNRFVQVTPVSSGDTFLVVFIRIEDTGNMSAIVPPATSFVVTYNGQTYSNNPYFDTSVLDPDEISNYTANFNTLPYQWIREIGNQRRDYAFLTGYNVFGQNQTTISNSTNSANITLTPPDTNGQGYFIKPGRSNAIDGYLIYEVPAAAAVDLSDTYVQVSFNSFSPTQWRLGK